MSSLVDAVQAFVCGVWSSVELQCVLQNGRANSAADASRITALTISYGQDLLSDLLVFLSFNSIRAHNILL